MKELNIFDYIRPLIAHRRIAPGIYPDGRFVGTCFFVSEQGAVITCSHIIDSLKGDEDLFSFDPNTNNFVPVKILFTHKIADFAVCHIDGQNNKCFTLRHDRVLLGRNVISYGFLNKGIIDKTIKIDYRVMKGHICRVDSDYSSNFRSNQIVEVSFPSLAGFSGAPIFDENTLDVLGMLFGNVESSIEVFSNTEINETGEATYKELVNRVIEYGVAYSIDTLVAYLEESKNNV